MGFNLDFLNPYSERFLRSSDDLAALNAVEKSRMAWGVSDTFDEFDARLELARRQMGSSAGMSAFTTASLLTEVCFQNKSQRMNWYRWMTNVPIIKKCLTIMTNDCVSPNEKDQYASLRFSSVFGSSLKPYQVEQLHKEFDYVCNKCLKADDRTLWDLFRQWLIDGEMFWEIIPSRDTTKPGGVIGINVLNPHFTYPVYNRGRIEGFAEHVPIEYAYALGIPASEQNILKFKPYQVAYANFGEFGICKQDVIGWLEPAIRSLNQLIQMEDSLLAIRVNRAVERILVNVDVGRVGPQQSKALLTEAKAEYNKSLKYDTASGRILHKARSISLREMFWFAIEDGRKTSMETLNQNTTLNGQIEDVKVFEKNVYDALDIAESRRGGATDATYSNKADITQQEMQMAASARRLADRFARNLVKKVFVQHLALRGYAPKYVNSDNYIVSMNRNNYYERSRMFELNSTRGELLNSMAAHIRSGENKKPLIARKLLLSEMLQFSDEELAQNERWLKEEELEFGDEEGGEGGYGMEGGDDVL